MYGFVFGIIMTERLPKQRGPGDMVREHGHTTCPVRENMGEATWPDDIDHITWAREYGRDDFTDKDPIYTDQVMG